jgi:hypothetical protein
MNQRAENERQKQKEGGNPLTLQKQKKKLVLKKTFDGVENPQKAICNI